MTFKYSLYFLPNTYICKEPLKALRVLVKARRHNSKYTMIKLFLQVIQDREEFLELTIHRELENIQNF